MYIVSLVVILPNWVCDNWLYRFPIRGNSPETFWEVFGSLTSSPRDPHGTSERGAWNGELFRECTLRGLPAPSGSALFLSDFEINWASPTYPVSAGAFKQALSNLWPQKTKKTKNWNFRPGRLGRFSVGGKKFKHSKNTEIPHLRSLPSGGQKFRDKNWTIFRIFGIYVLFLSDFEMTILFKVITRIKFLVSNYLGRYSYSFRARQELISVTVTVLWVWRIFLYSYCSVQLHEKMVRGIIFRKLQLQLHKEMVFELKMKWFRKEWWLDYN